MPDEPMTTPTTPEGRLYDAGSVRAGPRQADPRHRRRPTPAPPVPTEAQLRAHARELGVPVPRAREGTAERFRDDLLNLLNRA